MIHGSDQLLVIAVGGGRPHHRGMRIASLALTLGSLALLAEARAQGQSPTPPLGQRVDAVIATVNDSAILFSTLRMVAIGRIRSQEKELGPLTPADRDQIFREALEAEIDRHRMAQSAKSLGPLPPEQIDQIIQGEFERDRQAQLRDLGSYNELSQELKRIGRTWPTYEREQRIDKLSDIAEELTVQRRLARQANLFLTPRMLRETYEKNRARFLRDAAAKVTQVRFTGPDAQAAALAAAEMWRREPQLEARQVAARHPGSLAIPEVVAKDLAAEFAPVTTFALAGPEGEVSAPVAVGEAWFVAKVTAHVAARNGKFEDADVQEEVRNICYQQVRREFLAQAMVRARERTEVWRLQSTR